MLLYSIRLSGPFLKEVVQHWPAPRTVKDVTAFLGPVSYYRCYMPGFATVSAPLNNLTCHKVERIWDDKCEAAFRPAVSNRAK